MTFVHILDMTEILLTPRPPFPPPLPLDVPDLVRSVDAAHRLEVDFRHSVNGRIYDQNRPQAGNNDYNVSLFSPPVPKNENQSWQKAMDDSNPYVRSRWTAFLVLTLVYATRILVVQV